jgi:hypothetical protein
LCETAGLVKLGHVALDARLSARPLRPQPSIYGSIAKDHLNLAGRDSEMPKTVSPAVITPE